MPDTNGDRYKGKTLPELLAEASTLEYQGTKAVADQLKDQPGILGRIWGTILDFFSAQFDAVWGNWIKWFGPLFEPIVSFFQGMKDMASPDAHYRFVEGFIANGWLDKDDGKAIVDLLQRSGIMGHTMQILISTLLTSKIVGNFMDVIGATAIQKMNRTYSPTVPDPGQVLRASFVAPELHDKVVDAMKRSGLSESDIELLYISNYALYSPTEVKELYWRGELTEDKVNERLMEMGLTPTRIQELKKLWKRIPTLQDVTRYMGKEAFEPAMIAKFGLLEDYPRGEAENWAGKQGLEPKWAEAEWISHWRDLGVDFMLSAMHRRIELSDGTTVDAGLVDDYMRLIEIPPKLREIVRKTAYTPYTRVDARRMHKMGILNDDDLLSAYKDIGYDDEKAANMVLFTILYNQGEGAGLSQSDITKAYEDGDLDFNAALGLLVETGVREDYAGFLLSRIDLKKDRESRDAAIQLIKTKYVSNMMEAGETKNALISVGVTMSRAAELIDGWNVAREKGTKAPTKEDLFSMYREKIITESELVTELSRLSYSAKHIQWYVTLLNKG